MKTRFSRLLTLAAALALPITAFSQGTLNPPAGPPAPTMKTLEQIEPRTPISALPYVISQPGSYYLTRNLEGGLAGGLVIMASGVTLDLMGFTLGGGPGIGISVPGNRANVRIRNGTVRGWADAGIEAGNTVNAVMEDLIIANNGGRGLNAGQQAIVRKCVASSNGNTGLTTDAGSSVSHCLAFNNGGSGISVSFGCLVHDCEAEQNDGEGIVAVAASTVRNCVSRANEKDGIRVTKTCLVQENNCDGNGLNGDGAGIHVLESDNRVEGNKLTGNDRGLDVDGATNLILRNAARANTSGNYEIAAGNRVATIAVPPASGAISGNGPSAGSGTTDPVANFAY